MKILTIICFILSLNGCFEYDDYDFISKNSKEYFEKRGAVILSYEGFYTTPYSRKYCYVTKLDNIIYESCLAKYKNEIHEYNLKALNAIGGK